MTTLRRQRCWRPFFATVANARAAAVVAYCGQITLRIAVQNSTQRIFSTHLAAHT